jgi:DNA mismatch repair ATPase MutS
MTKTTSPEQFFRTQTALYGKQLAQTTQNIRQTAVFRITVFLLTVLGIYLSSGFSLTAVAITAGVGFSVFGFFVARHIRLYKEKKRIDKLLEINENELRLLHLDTSFQWPGTEFREENHPFADDLDLFGKGSLFQLLDRTATRHGQEFLAHSLLHPLTDKNRIEKRQQAIRELTALPQWRQEFQAKGVKHEHDSRALADLLEWAENNRTNFDHPVYRFLLIVTPLLGISDLILVGWGILPPLSILLFLILPFAVLMPVQEKINRMYDLLGKKTALSEQYARLFQHFENREFQSDILQQARKTLAGNKDSAYAAVRQLSAITRAFDYRLNLLAGFFLNTFFLWDILQIRRLDKWKKRYHEKLSLWFDTLAQTDALCSLAGFAFQHPKAVYPEIRQGSELLIRGENLKHPFLPEEKCVGNPVEISGWRQFQIITGANMAGKSTYLRTVGITLLLGMTGLPVQADRFSFTPVNLFTGIHTSDSLQEGESYFFAELKRLKEIIDRLKNGEKLFIILDEILRGTNSKDKQTGSRALLRRFIQLGASGMIATHDLTLGELKNEFPGNVENKRFEVEIENDRMRFDYRLKEGISRNLNASFLMKKMGITD